jgi:hypothetical protein
MAGSGSIGPGWMPPDWPPSGDPELIKTAILGELFTHLVNGLHVSPPDEDNLQSKIRIGTPQQLSDALASLEQDGYITRIPGLSNLVSDLVFLTPQGIRFVGRSRGMATQEDI